MIPNRWVFSRRSGEMSINSLAIIRRGKDPIDGYSGVQRDLTIMLRHPRHCQSTQEEETIILNDGFASGEFESMTRTIAANARMCLGSKLRAQLLLCVRC